MPANWLIETRLGDHPEATPLRRRRVSAEDEAEALRIVAEEAQADVDRAAADELLIDGQEEVFARAEFDTRPEHHVSAGGEAPEPSTAAQAQRSGDR
ncbi:MAG: hypothetical protein ACK4Z5_05075 [Brevundimonas sp.]